MPKNSIELDLNAVEAKQVVEAWKAAVGEGGTDAVDALTILAENSMRREAPEGSGKSKPQLRDSIDTKPETGDRRVVMPFKRTSEGWLLVRAIVGNPGTPTYDDEKPPIGPLMEWARAKLGDEQAGWAIRESIYQEGHETFPNPFVDRSMNEWENSVEEIAGEAVRDALD